MTVIGAYKLLAMTVKLHLSVNVTVLHNFVPASAYVYVYVCMHVCRYVCMYVCMYVYIYKIVTRTLRPTKVEVLVLRNYG